MPIIVPEGSGFSTATVTHTFHNADGTAASGVVEFALDKRITNGTLTITPASVSATLSSEGKISQSLTANADSGTIPEDSRWRVDFRIQGAPLESFWIVVPSGGGTVDLGSLLPDQPLGG